MPFSFTTVDVKQELADELKKQLPLFGFTQVKVVKADPQAHSEIPCIGINRIDDSESAQSLTDGQITQYDKTTKEYDTYYGTFFSEAMEIRIWHTNADERDKLYQTVKAVLFAARIRLGELGLLNMSLRGGKDEQDASMSQAPVPLYWAPIYMSYLNPLDIKFVEHVEPITAIVENSSLKE